MTKKESLRERIISVSEYLFALVLVLNCNSIWTSIPIFSSVFSYICAALLVGSVISCILLKGKIRPDNGTFILAFSIMSGVYFAIYSIANPLYSKNILSVMLEVLVIVTYFTFCNDNSIPSILYKYQRIIFIIAIESMIFWLLCSQLRIIPQTGTIISKWTGSNYTKVVKSYMNLYFEPQTISIFTLVNIARNSAIFTEAPMSSLHFSIALLIELYLVKQPNKTIVTILVLAIITTFSFTGYILIIYSLITKYLLRTTRTQASKAIKIVSIPVLLLVLVTVASNLLIDKLATSSGITRIDDYVAGFRAWLDNPIFGNGFNNNDAIKQFMSDWRNYNLGYSNSFMLVFAQGGIYVGSIYLIAFGKGIVNSLKSYNYNKMFFVIAIFYLFALTIFPYNSLMLFLIIWFYTTNKKSTRIYSESFSKVRQTTQICQAFSGGK